MNGHGITEADLTRFDEAQACIRQLPWNFGLRRAEGRLSAAKCAAADRAKEIEQALGSEKWQACFRLRSDQRDKRVAVWRADRHRQAEAALRERGLAEGDRVFLDCPILDGLWGAVRYEGTVKIGKNGHPYVSARGGGRRAERLCPFKNPWRKTAEVRG